MSIEDLIKAAHEGNPADMQAVFNDVIKDKMADALEARKEAMLNSMYDDDDDEDISDEGDDYDDDETEDPEEELDIEDIEDEDV